MQGPVNGSVAPGPAQLDAVTFDANGTLLRLIDPVPALADVLRRRGVDRTEEEVAAAFAAEASHYAAHCSDGRDDGSLASLRLDCASVFLEAARAPLDAREVIDDYNAAFAFEALPAAARLLRRLRASGLALAIVSNWDVSMHTHLGHLGLASLVDVAVASSDAGASKPDPRIFEHTLGLLGVRPERTLHVGDSRTDADGAAAAGLHFASAPAEAVFAEWR